MILNFFKLIGFTKPTDRTATNLKAFLMVIKYCEHGKTDDAVYYIRNGGSKLTSLASHPMGKGAKGTTSASGAYQIVKGTWLEVKAKLNLPDFSPKSQDLAAVSILKSKGALELIKRGKLEQAIKKLPYKLWTSLPGKFEQQKTIAQVKVVYEKAGGKYI